MTVAIALSTKFKCIEIDYTNGLLAPIKKPKPPMSSY